MLKRLIRNIRYFVLQSVSFLVGSFLVATGYTGVCFTGAIIIESGWFVGALSLSISLGAVMLGAMLYSSAMKRSREYRPTAPQPTAQPFNYRANPVVENPPNQPTWQPPLFAVVKPEESRIMPYDPRKILNLRDCSVTLQNSLYDLAKDPLKLSEKIAELGELSPEEEKLFEEFNDPILLDYMDFPVKLGCHYFDIRSLSQLAKMQNPLTRAPFRATDLEEATDLIKKIKKTIADVVAFRNQTQPAEKLLNSPANAI